MAGSDQPMKVVKGDVGELLGRLTADDLARSERGKLLLALTRALGGAVRAAGSRAALSGRLLVDLLVDDVAPRLQVRDLLTLRLHHRGLSGDELAEALIRNAARTTAAIGAAAGAVAAAELTAPPALLAAPVQLTAETLAAVVVELKLVAELHVVYSRAPQGSSAQLAVAYLTSWAGKRGLDVKGQGPSLTAALSTATKQQLRQRVVQRLGRNLSSFIPFLAGALAGAELNRRETRSLGEALVRDLRPHRLGLG
ncbi:MAG: hypothetical protein JWM02_475 [Frankiales bacterium]|nr:hypothetical protein [Frankiales bacterium]